MRCVWIPSWLMFVAVTLSNSNPALAIAWQNEVNVSICSWEKLRGGQLKRKTWTLTDMTSKYYPRYDLSRWGDDLVANVVIIHEDRSLAAADFADSGLSDGEYASPQSDGNPSGVMYNLSLSIPFDERTNLTGLFNAMPKNSGSLRSIAPNYNDGAMFANDNEFILYGSVSITGGIEPGCANEYRGLSRLTDSQELPPGDVVLGYQEYEWGSPPISWQPGFVQRSLPTGVTRYVTNGAGVSAPSENLGFYFSGMRGENWGRIEEGDQTVDTIADTLITVNMSSMRREFWQNTTLPADVPGRANAELVWIPVSESGVLIAIGGVVNPVILTAAQELTAEEAEASVCLRSPPPFFFSY